MCHPTNVTLDARVSSSPSSVKTRVSRPGVESNRGRTTVYQTRRQRFQRRRQRHRRSRLRHGEVHARNSSVRSLRRCHSLVAAALLQHIVCAPPAFALACVYQRQERFRGMQRVLLQTPVRVPRSAFPCSAVKCAPVSEGLACGLPLRKPAMPPQKVLFRWRFVLVGRRIPRQSSSRSRACLYRTHLFARSSRQACPWSASSP